MKAPSSFCPLPWSFISTTNTGDFRLCSSAQTSECKGIYRKQDSTPYNIGRDFLSESRNATLAKEIRKTMLQGLEHPACLRCQQEEANGLPSRRLREKIRQTHEGIYELALKHTSSDGTIDTSSIPIRFFDLRLGNQCNLKCRSCSPSSSNQCYDDFVQTWGNTHYVEEKGEKVDLVKNDQGKWEPVNDLYSWVESDHFFHHIDFDFNNLKMLHLTGGEPLLAEKHLKILEKCIQEDRAQHITLDYNTNATFIPNKLWSLWPMFKEVSIGISIDGIGKVNDYIRHPSQWKKVEAIIHRLDCAPGNFNLRFTPTIQIYNILDLPRMIQWKITSQFKRINNWQVEPLLSPHLLHNPKFLNIKALPREVKPKITTILRNSYPALKQCLEDHSKQKREERNRLYNKAIELIEGHISFMQAEDLSQHFSRFQFYTRQLDKIRGEKLEEVCPELFQILTPYYRDL